MGKFRVMTWNVQNLLGIDHPDGPDTLDELDAKIQALADIVDIARPHVLALQEVGDDAVVARFQQALTWRLPHRALGVPDDRGIRVAFCSARVIRRPTDVWDFPPRLSPVQVGDDPPGPGGPATILGMGRGALDITVRANSRDVRVVNCHLKSKLLSFPGPRFFTRDEDERARFGAYALYRRAAEATTIRTWMTDAIDGRGENDPVILLGDMNDEVVAATTQILNGPPGSEIGTRGFASSDRGDAHRLFNLAPLIPPELRATRVFRGRGELIDHIFATHFLVMEGRTVDVTTLSALGGPLPSIDEDPRDTRGDPGSDHAAVLATFDF